MKTAPTDIDREAATLFSAAPGMRVRVQVDAQDDALVRIDWCRVAESTWAGGLLLHRLSSSQALASCVDIIAIDTDDPATVGCMHVQVDQAEGLGMAVEVYSLPGGWFGTSCPGEGGRTRGSALVAAMRQLKKDRT